MQLARYTVGPYGEHCYLLYLDDGQCLIIDPGDQADFLIQEITQLNVRPQAILLTHAHFDHILAVEALRDHYQIPLWQDASEANWLVKRQSHPATTPTYFWDHEGDYAIAGFKFQLAHLPGHSPGSVVFIFNDFDFVIAGDTLFKGTVGRTDLEDGDHELLINGIKKHLLTLPDQVRVFPGHGQATSIAEEKANNPFFK